MTQIKFFQPADGGEWHAYREESAQALCGEAQLSYNRDRVSDFVPTDGALHDGCRQAIDAENPAPYQPSIDPVEDPVEETEATGETSDGEETDNTASDAAASESQPDTQEITSGDVAPLASILGEPTTEPISDEPSASQPPA